MKTAMFMFVVIATTMASSVIPSVYADKPNDPSGFGEAASENLADDRQMGDHSSDPAGDGTNNPDDRSGIGNVLNQGDPKDDPDSKHPSDLADALCPPGSTNSACTDEGDPND